MVVHKKKTKSQKHIHVKVGNVKQTTARVPKWILPIILFITFLAFIPVLKAGFVNWDDGDYTYNNYLIRDLSHLKLLLTTSVQGNHHPLTMLSLAINYVISGNDPWSYHLLNLLFHLINCFLVFRFALLISSQNITVAFTTAVLFGIHPLHVESVAWVSERKDVLYGLFFLSGLISYTKYVDNDSKKQYWLTVLFLILALSSKPAAVIFPVALFCIDLLRKRKIDSKLFLEKIPFFILAIIIGIITFFEQKEAGTIGGAYSFFTNVLFGFYGIMTYFVKMIFPVNLSAFYPLPPINQSLSVGYYIAPLFFALLAALFFYSLKRNRIISFGILFYLVNLLLVLQILSVGSAIIAERYTYIPYIGLFLIIGWLIDKWTHGIIAKASPIIIAVSVILSIVTFKQASVWTNSASLWDHAIKTNPSSQAYGNRASLLREEKNYELAIQYYNEALSINSIDEESYMNRGNVYKDLGNFDLAYADYRKALSLKPENPEGWDNLGALYGIKGQYDSSLYYLSRAIKALPDYMPAYKNRALAYLNIKRYNDAINDFKKFLQYDDDADIHNAIGVCYQNMEKWQEAIAAFSKAIELSSNAVFYLNRSYAYNSLKNIESAKRDALVAKQKGAQIPAEYARFLGIQ
jgi:protein O-mannosyl-transferase